MTHIPSSILKLSLTSVLLLFLPETAPCAEEGGDDDAQLRWLLERQPGLQVTSQRASRIESLRELQVGHDQIVYLSQDGKTVVIGQMIDLVTGHNLTEQSQDLLRQRMLSTAMPGDLFQFPAEHETDRITVVTDIDCTYCRRLHTELDELHARGIGVQYLMLPRSGNPSPSWDKAVWAACAANPEQALTEAMNGQPGTPVACEHSIAEQAGLAASMRLNATPAIIFESGRLINSYLTPDQISEQIRQQSTPTASD